MTRWGSQVRLLCRAIKKGKYRKVFSLFYCIENFFSLHEKKFSRLCWRLRRHRSFICAMSFFATQKNSRVLLTNIKSFPFFIATRIFSLHEKKFSRLCWRLRRHRSFICAMSFFATQKNSRMLLTNSKPLPFFIVTRTFFVSSSAVLLAWGDSEKKTDTTLTDVSALLDEIMRFVSKECFSI